MSKQNTQVYVHEEDGKREKGENGDKTAFYHFLIHLLILVQQRILNTMF